MKIVITEIYENTENRHEFDVMEFDEFIKLWAQIMQGMPNDLTIHLEENDGQPITCTNRYIRSREELAAFCNELLEGWIG